MKNNQLLKLWAVVLVFGFVFSAIPTQAITPSVKINNNYSTTKIRKVDLTLIGSTDVRQMKISNDISFSGSQWEIFKSTKTWYLDYGNGTKTVYVKFKDKNGQISEFYKDTIQLSAPVNMTVDFKIDKIEDDEPGASETDKRYVKLFLEWSEGVEKVRVSNTDSFSEIDYLWIDDVISWVLTPESGEKTIYVEFKDANGTIKVVSKKIIYNQPKHYIPEGSLLKGQSSTVYYLGFDGKVHPFWGGAVYHSWYSDFSEIKYVSNVKLSEYQLGVPVCVRPGTWLLKFKGLPNVYSVGPGCRLHLIRSEGEAIILYGSKWSERILELDMVLMGYYTIDYREAVEAGVVDKDKDGISKEDEDDYGTSDTSKDSDSDGLSDYEELFYWFSDPNDPDTDGDGYLDGLEVLSGYSPSGVQKITAVDEGTYSYPEGTLLFEGGSYYYIGENGVYRYISKKSTDPYFTSNKFQTKFVITPPINIPFSYSANNRLGKSVSKIIRPQVRTNKGNLINL
ncbi:MAG: hypothetical protein ABIJ23_01950 [Candidatus Magasanikbacteria bacterium]